MAMASWQSEQPSLASRISYLLKKEIMSDVMFLVGEHQQKFPCHKLLLGAGSQVFQTMFYGDIPERSEVVVPDIAPPGFSVMLEYLYKDKVSLEGEDVAFEAAYAAKKYMINGLFQECEDFLTRKVILTAKLVCSIYEQASILEMKRLKEMCLRYMGKNAMEVFRSESFNVAAKSTVEDMLAMDLLDIESELQLLHALWQWGRQQCRLQEVDCSGENVKLLVADLLPYIRFLTVSVQEFNEITRKYKFLDSSEEMALLLRIAKPKNSFLHMPKNFSTVSKKRSASDCCRIDLPLTYRYSGSYSSFSLPIDKNIVTISVDAGLLTILGVVFVYKPIPCYSPSHRNMDISIVCENLRTNVRTCADVFLKAKLNRGEEKHELLLKYPLLVSEKETAKLTATVKGEGVELLQYTEEEISSKIGDTSVKVVLSSQNESKTEFIINQILCI